MLPSPHIIRIGDKLITVRRVIGNHFPFWAITKVMPAVIKK